MKPTEQMLELRGTRVRVLRGGSGAPLIFLHGASGHVGWLPFLDTLSRRFDVIAPEHPGFGASDDPKWLDRPADLAYFYLDLIEHLNLDDVHLVGTSLGGWIAAELAVRNTSWLASLTLVCAVGVTPKGGAMEDMFRMSAEENARRFYFDPERVRRRLEALATADPRALVRNRSTVVRLSYPDFVNPELGKWLHRIDVPTLLVWGADDMIVPVEHGRTAHAAMPESRLEVFERAGHFPFHSHPQRFLTVLREFLATTEPAHWSPAEWRALLRTGRTDGPDDEAVAAAPLPPTWTIPETRAETLVGRNGHGH
jgi:pimeloyl-ACP methyl ester carboxylesterase